MFPDAIENEVSLQRTVLRGKALARAGRVGSYSVDYIDDLYGIIQLDAAVAGSSGQRYDTWVTLDMIEETVESYDCTCPAAREYYGMCKHEVALALTYLEDCGIVELRGSTSDLLELTDDELASPAAGSFQLPPQVTKGMPKEQRGTDPLLMELISAHDEAVQQRATARAAVCRGYEGTPADFNVIIARSAGYGYYGSYRSAHDEATWEMRLKIRCGKASYVVKRMDTLVNKWQAGEFFEYGKNLAFVHSPAAFTQRANEILEFIAQAVRSQQALASQSRYWYSITNTGGKELPLSASDLVRLLDIMQGDEVTFEPDWGYGRNRTEKLAVVQGERPNVTIALTAGEDGGFDLLASEKKDCVIGEDALYVLGGGKAVRIEGDVAHKVAPVLKVLLPSLGYPLHVNDRDMPSFCAAVLPSLELVSGFTAPDGFSELLPPAPEFSFRLGAADGYVVCAASVSYGNTTLGLFEDAQPDHPARDIELEFSAQQIVRTYFPYGDTSAPDYSRREPNRYLIAYERLYSRQRGSAANPGEPDLPWFPEDDVENLYLLLTDGLQAMSAMGEVLLSERLRGVEVRRPPEIQVHASARSGLLDLEVDAEGLSMEDLLNYLASYRRKQRYVRLTNGDIMRLGEGIGALNGLVDSLGLTDDQVISGQTALPTNRALFVDALMKDAPGVRFDRNRAFRSIVRSFDTIADSDFVVPAALRGVLRPYQRVGFKWLSTLSELGFGGILADDMGLGKTVQLIALLAARKHDGVETPSLVVCPASLVYNWAAEFERFAPELDVAPVVGPKSARMALIGAAADHDVLVTSYDLMKRDVDAYAAGSFDIVTLDEAQYIKNHATKSAKAAKRLPSSIRFALTGTPIENRLSELWSIFDFLMPGILGSHDAFARRFVKPIEAGEEGAAERLQKLVSPFILRRLKGDVLDDLPDKNEMVVYASMEGEQEKLYKANVAKLAMSLSQQLPEEFAHNKLAVLAELTRLRQICCDPHLCYENYEHGSAKLETCMELVANAVEGGHKVLLFSQFTSMLDIIAERMASAGTAHLMLTGATSKEQRVRLVREFQEGPAPVFLISLKAGGVGLNLTAADIVIHFDPWWNLAAQNQATDRAHRIGQTRDVSVFKLIAKGTIEEKIVKMQEAKRDLAESVIGGEASSSAALTREDVLALLDV